MEFLHLSSVELLFYIHFYLLTTHVLFRRDKNP